MYADFSSGNGVADIDIKELNVEHKRPSWFIPGEPDARYSELMRRALMRSTFGETHGQRSTQAASVVGIG